MTCPIGGHTDPRFASVRLAFEELLATGAETGAALAVTYDGRVVVDLHGGWCDAGDQRPWTSRSLVNVFSVGKPVAALCVLLLIEQGRLGLDEPVARHWPQFTAGDVQVRHVLAHTAGLPVFPTPRPATAVADWDQLTADLAAGQPRWTPGTVAAEHALTYGHLAGELVRRIDGRPVGRFLADEISGRWGLDLAVGLSPADRKRCVDLVYGDPDWPRTTLGRPGSLRALALGNPAGCLDLEVLNSAGWRGSEMPAVNLHATATALARLYAGLLAGGVLDGVRLLADDTVAEAVRTQYDGHDVLLERPVRWTLGMQLDDDGTWGMGGIGGNLAFADPVRGYTFAYVTRHLADFARADVLTERVIDVIGG